MAESISASNNGKLVSAIFVTFSGNCRKALTFYQSCFGGTLRLETFEEELQGYTEMPVISGSLVSDRIIIHGTDLVHNEGRTLGNYISIFLYCAGAGDRKALIEKLSGRSGQRDRNNRRDSHDEANSGCDDELQLVEIIDAFDLRWVLAV